jgi:WD40 repeat protein
MRLRARDNGEAEKTPNSGNAVASIAWWQPAGHSGPDAKSGQIAIGSNNGLVRVCDANGKKVRDLGTHRSKTVVRSVAWSPDGRLAAGSDDMAVRIWSGDDWHEQVLPPHEAAVRSVAWSGDGLLASGSDDRTVRIWSPDGELLLTLVGHEGPVNSVAWSPDGWLASGSDDKTVRIWTAAGHTVYKLSGHDGPVTAVAWSPDGRLASGSADMTVKLWPRPLPVDQLKVLAGQAPLRELSTDRRRDLLLPVR